jgi:hypothetical protein
MYSPTGTIFLPKRTQSTISRQSASGFFFSSSVSGVNSTRFLLISIHAAFPPQMLWIVVVG